MFETPQGLAGERILARRAEIEAAGMRVGRRFLLGTVIEGELAGARFEHYFVPSADGKRLAGSAVALATAAAGAFVVSSKKSGIRTDKPLGKVEEFCTGDPAIDQAYDFSGATVEHLREVFGVRENLGVVLALLTGGFDRLEKRGKRIVVTKPGAELLDFPALKRAVELLAKLILPPAPDPQTVSSYIGQWKWLILRAAMTLILFIAGCMGIREAHQLLEGTAAFAVSYGALPVCAVLIGAIVAAAYSGVKGRPISGTGFAEFVVHVPLLAVALVGILMIANERFDTSEAEVQQVRITKRYVTTVRSRSRGIVTDGFYLQFEPWRDRKSLDLSVSPQTYDRFRAGQLLRVRIRQGWLEHAWIESMVPLK